MKSVQITPDQVPDGAYLVAVGAPPGEEDWCDGVTAIGWPNEKGIEHGPTALVRLEVMFELDDHDLATIADSRQVVLTFWGGMPPFRIDVADNHE